MVPAGDSRARRAEQINRVRRGVEQVVDQRLTAAFRWMHRPATATPFDGTARFAVLTVNFSTTRYLSLMLASLLEQDDLDRVVRLVVCDNHSRDGAERLLAPLSQAGEGVVVVRNRWFTHHARGIRTCLRALARAERETPADRRANVLLAVDPDVVFLRPDALTALTRVFAEGGVAFAGQLRRDLFPLPEAQASFLAVRRDWADRSDVSPWVNHGSPAWFQQRDIWRAGGRGVDFRSNADGYVLHRGRSGVAAAGEYAAWSSYATVRTSRPHYMGQAEGAATWEGREAQLATWLEPGSERRLADALAARIG